MPDSAFAATEDQFRQLAGSSHENRVELELYTFTEIPRTERITALIQARYRSVDALWAHPPEAMIVTGTEPVRPRLCEEPYWPHLARLLEWAADSVPTTMLSCLAAHAFTLLFDDLERTPRESKCSGVFAGAVSAGHPLVNGLPELVSIPHSRFNEVAEADLVLAGYEIAISSGPSPVGWSVATCRRGAGDFVLCQGHPEYETLSLLREYRRDVRRSLFSDGKRPYPRVPEGYLPAEAEAMLEAFAQRAPVVDLGPDELWQQFPYDEVARCIRNTWAETAAVLYRNWLDRAGVALPLAA